MTEENTAEKTEKKLLRTTDRNTVLFLFTIVNLMVERTAWDETINKTVFYFDEDKSRPWIEKWNRGEFPEFDHYISGLNTFNSICHQGR